jgi:threonylcarbamoyladenosine tRNA methylthiotransferase MtaB
LIFVILYLYKMHEKKTIAFYTLGCKLNYAETMSYHAEAMQLGYTEVNFKETADVYVINSCTVTKLADKKSLHAIVEARKLNKLATIIVTGCFSALNKKQILTETEADFALSLNEKNRIKEILQGHYSKTDNKTIKSGQNYKTFFSAFNTEGRTRSFLKIQDGCDYFCSYCTIPYARGNSRSQSIKETLKQINQIAASGIKEIVLTGVNIGDFGKNNGESLLNLLREIENININIRIRLGSIEPNLLNNEIIEIVAKSNKLMPHFHIPLQSGSNEMLKIMKRRYQRELYADKVKLIKTLMPEAFIGMDLIVGVAGETEALFNDSIEFINSLPVSFIHVFTYSERAGTAALKIKPVISKKERKHRSKLLHQLSETKHLEFLKSSAETESEVLWEHSNSSDKYMYGFTKNYIKAVHKNIPTAINTITQVKIVEQKEKELMAVKII